MDNNIEIKNLMQFGQYCGLTYNEVIYKYPDYYTFLIKKYNNHYGLMLKFIEYVREYKINELNKKWNYKYKYILESYISDNDNIIIKYNNKQYKQLYNDHIKTGLII